MAQYVDLVYKRSNTMKIYLKIFACKISIIYANSHQTEHSIQIFTRFCCQFYHSHHLWLHDCCWPNHSQNSCHKQLELLILSVQECMVTSRIFRSQSFFQFLTQCQTKAEICLKTFCQIRWSENWTWFYCFIVWWQSLSLHDVMKFSNLTVRKVGFITAGSRK